MPSPTRRSLSATRGSPGKSALVLGSLPKVPTNELIVNDWERNRSKSGDTVLLKIVSEMPKETGNKKKKRKASKKGYAGKLKMKTCPHILFNMYFPEPLVETFEANHNFQNKNSLTRLMVYQKMGPNDLNFTAEITCNTHPCTPSRYLDNGFFIINDSTGPGGLIIVPTSEKERFLTLGTPPPWNPNKYNTALTFYELRWFMDHPYYATAVLTVVADHTVMAERKSKKDEPVKKPKPTSFIGRDYSNNLEDVLRRLCKCLVFVTRKINPEKTDEENEDMLSTLRATLSAKQQSYTEQAPFTLSPIQTSCFQPKPPKKGKTNPKFAKLRAVHVTTMPLKINEKNLQRKAEEIATKKSLKTVP